MIESLAVLRKEGCPALRNTLQGDPSNQVGYSALDLIMRLETHPFRADGYRTLVLEAPRRSDLPWDELEVMRAVRRVNQAIETIIFIDEQAHSWCKDPMRTPEGAEALIERLSSHSLAPRLFTGELDQLTPSELQSGWRHLNDGNRSYRMTPSTQSPKVNTRYGFRQFMEELVSGAINPLLGSHRALK